MSSPSDPVRRSRSTINPYRFAARLVWDRAGWDLTAESWRSRRKLSRVSDAYRGEKAVILCNGPSLNRVDFAKLDNVFSFGLNKIHLLFDETWFRPSCIVSVNDHVVAQSRDFFNETDIPLYLTARARKSVAARPNVAFLHSCGARGFARDCGVSVYESGTVTYVALQLAFHMGFDDVALVGCDHSFGSNGPPNAVRVGAEVDSDHFHPKYFAGETWQLPDLALSELGYETARRVFEGFGRRVVNATDGGALEIFPRMSLDAFVSGDR